MQFEVTKEHKGKKVTAKANVDVPNTLDGLCEKWTEEKTTEFAVRAIRTAINNKMGGVLTATGNVELAAKAGVEWEPATRMTPVEKAIKQIQSLGLPPAAEKQAIDAILAA